jgi:hypothetical protein
MMRSIKEKSISITAAEKLSPEERLTKIVRGVLWDVQKPGYLELYDKILQRAQEANHAK